MQNNRWGLLISVFLCALLTSFITAEAGSQDYAVMLSAQVQNNPPQIKINIPTGNNVQLPMIYRKLKTVSTWGNAIALSPSDTYYIDNTVQTGLEYEYMVTRNNYEPGANSTVAAQGYISTGIDVPQVDCRGKMILLVDNTFSVSLANELLQLESDLRGDGWQVIRHDVSRTGIPQQVKSIIVSDYNNDPANVKMVYLFGHVPVALAGNNAWGPDGHTGRAWPCDAYYGDMNGTWTDSSNDGCFDQLFMPSDIELQVGRVDLYSMPLFSKTEEELLRQYLNKAHNYKINQTPYVRKTFVKGDFNASYSFSGYECASLTGGKSGVDYGPNYKENTISTPYLWADFDGGGTYTGFANGSLLTYDFANSPKEFKSLFNISFGSYFGEWNNTNNFLRAPLAQQNYGLTNVWGARPNWFFHHMGMGENIGYSTKITMNNSTLYQCNSNIAQRGIHISLMGDPSLRLYPVTPPSDGMAQLSSDSAPILRWQPSANNVIGYHIYRSNELNGMYTRITASPISDTFYRDSAVAPVTQKYYYMVRAVKLEINASGSFYNLSQGLFISADTNTPATSAYVAPSFEEGKIVFADEYGNQIKTIGDNGFVNASVKFSNHKTESIQPTFIVALYDKNNKLLRISCVKRGLAAGDSDTVCIGFEIPDNHPQWYIKTMLWDSFGSVMPLNDTAILQ